MNRDDLFRRIGDISDALIWEAGRPERRARRLRRSTAVALAAAVLMLFGISAFAASTVLGSRSSHGSSRPDYYSVPAGETLRQDVGFELHVIDTFSNGYQFQTGSILEQRDLGEDGAVLEQYRGLDCVYACDGERLDFYVDSAAAGNQLDGVEAAENYKGCALKYYAYTSKLVPAGYVLNEQDQRDKASGKYVFSYGSADIEVHQVQGLGFEYGGLNYVFSAIDSSVTEDLLLQMAREVIDGQN